MMTTDIYTLCSMRAADGGARLLLQVLVQSPSGKEVKTLSVFSARLARTPRCGALTEEEYRGLCHEAELTHAMDIGLRLLGANGASQLQLVQKMQHRGVKSETARMAVRELADRGYLDECRGALHEAGKGLGKLWGDRRILADLRAKGYGEAALSEAAALLAGENGAERCAKLMVRRRMVLPRSEGELSRFMASLMRYGYTAGEIKRACRLYKDLNP